MSEVPPSFHPLRSPQDCPVYVDATAPSDKPLLILIHGFMMSRAIWDENVSMLSRHFRCVRIELLGHGRSSAPDAAAPYEMASYVNAIENIRQQTGASKCSFCAHSFGAGLALSYGLEFPDKTNAIVFTNSRSALGALDNTPDELERVIQALQVQGQSVLDALPIHPKHMNELKRSVQTSLIADAELLSPTGIANSLSVTAASADLFDRLTQLKPPTLLINGTRERGFQSARNRLGAEHPHITIQDVEAGHSANAEHPEIFNERAIEFLTRVQA